MYLCVLTSRPEPNDVPYDPSPHMNGFKWKQHLVSPKNVQRQLRELAGEGVDVFFNLCDGTPDDALSGIGLVQTMEKLALAFTGADSSFFDPSRQEMKAYAKKSNVPIPNWVMVDRVEDVERVSKRAAEQNRDQRAEFAIELFCYRVRKYLGAYLAVLGGADAVVFGGGIGEQAPEIRRRICDGMDWCGLKLSPERNRAAVGLAPGGAAQISMDGSPLAAYVVAADEEIWIAKKTVRSVKGL